jgi:hypothetical protein
MLLFLFIIAISYTGCGISTLNYYDDYATNAQSDTQQMADSIMSEMEKWEIPESVSETTSTPQE